MARLADRGGLPEPARGRGPDRRAVRPRRGRGRDPGGARPGRGLPRSRRPPPAGGRCACLRRHLPRSRPSTC
ncbi:hypothetical protein EXE59_11120 [Nocardioides eburneiflavus]|uniref:Uncharacterized protein n=1 Tax=Nocardioides eburneiflavus TaxID=2518372 RepID=A0A4Z1BT48_9ACTN|nr:hypothetical protein EXE59_11120 [Nocardioides eburneiflavus]